MLISIGARPKKFLWVFITSYRNPNEHSGQHNMLIIGETEGIWTLIVLLVHFFLKYKLFKKCLLKEREAGSFEKDPPA